MALFQSIPVKNPKSRMHIMPNHKSQHNMFVLTKYACKSCSLIVNLQHFTPHNIKGESVFLTLTG